MQVPFLKNLTVRLACLLLAVSWGGAAQAQYLLTGNSGGELQIGTGLPLPIGPNGIYLGGMTTGTGGPAYFPDLLVPPDPAIQFGLSPTRTIMQTGGTTQGGAVQFPPGVLQKAAPGSPQPIAVFTTNPAVFQVATSISYAWPAASATFSPGGAPGPAVLGTGLAGGVIAYSGGTKSFGGAGRFSLVAGPGASGGRVPPNTAGVDPVASVWINFQGALPTLATRVAVVGASNPNLLGEPGAPIGASPDVTAFGPLAAGFGAINGAPPGTPNCCDVTAMGGIVSSIPLPAVGLSNMVTASQGFPWTTGFITISQPGAVPPEVFFLSGTDMRVAGVGNLSLVSGALSTRALSGPNANRGWLSLRLVTPEPSAALAAVGALAMLGVCHGLVRRRSR